MPNFIKEIAPKAFNDGLARCNVLGKKLVRNTNVKSFLDLGCGDGSLTMDFAGIIKPGKIYAIEFMDEDRKKAEKKGIKCLKSDLNSFFKFKSSSFDIILSSQNIEHLHNTRLYLEECYRVLKPGGQLIVLTENLASWLNIFSLLFGWQPFSTANINGWSAGNPMSYHRDKEKNEKFVKKYTKTLVSGAVGHVRVLAYHGLEELMTRIGYSDVKLYTRGWLPFWGPLSDFMCTINKRHGHFLIATGFKDKK
jgi:ubiquinone/menaquinone biosynthesis C-methylase UbiE